MGRYEEQIQAILPELQSVPSGVIFLEVPPGEHEAVAAVIPKEVLGERRSLVVAARGGRLPRRAAIVGLAAARGPGAKGASRSGKAGDQPESEARGTSTEELLRELDAKRERIGLEAIRLFVIADAREMVAIEREAGSLFSVRRYDSRIAFEPDPSVDFDAARAELGRYLTAMFGRLNLRGLVRSEGEDVAFRMEDVYQELTFRSSRADSFEPDASTSAENTLRILNRLLNQGSLEELIERRRGEQRSPFMILGFPGSGKSALLRWLALRSARERMVLGLNQPLPVLVTLAEFARQPARRTLLEHIEHRWLADGQPAAHVLRRARENGRALFLLDGLDEISGAACSRIRTEVRDLHRTAPGCLMFITSRLAGYEPDPALKAEELRIEPFDDESIRRFLIAWCGLYAQERMGYTMAAREEGAREGERLSGDVLGNPSVRELAGNPLLLTILGIVHRAGVRLPDHRVELYEQITRVLVERWNRVRSHAPEGDEAPPLKSADAVRLLGPLALRVIESGNPGAIPEEIVRAELEKVLRTRSLRLLATPGEAIELFSRTLGLLVEQGPGQFAFLHLTLGEYFAAWELARSSAFEHILGDPARTFQARFREPILLAFGILGVLRADDERLERALGVLLQSYGTPRDEAPSDDADSLLLGIVADDPNLSDEQASCITGAFLGTWQFQSPPGGALSDPLRRIGRSRHGDRVRSMIQARVDSLQTDIPTLWSACFLLNAAQADYGEAAIRAIHASLSRREPDGPSRVIHVPPNADVLIQRQGSGIYHFEGTVSRKLDEEVRREKLPISLLLGLGLYTGSASGEWWHPIAWDSTRVAAEDGVQRRIEGTVLIPEPFSRYLTSGAAAASLAFQLTPLASSPPVSVSDERSPP